MGDADNYPPGAYNDPRAPYNQVDPEPIDVETEITCTLVNKSITVSTDDYIQEEDGVDISTMALKNAYEDGTIYTLPELLNTVTEMAFANMQRIEKKLKELREQHKPVPNKVWQAYRKWEKIYKSSGGWELDDYDIGQV